MEKFESLEFLSKLKFSDEEKIKFKKEFENILAFVDEIVKLDLPCDMKEDEAIGLESLRDDVPMESMTQEEILQNAPKQKDGCYLAPLVVE